MNDNLWLFLHRGWGDGVKRRYMYFAPQAIFLNFSSVILMCLVIVKESVKMERCSKTDRQSCKLYI